MAHDALDAWLDQLEADTAETPTLRAISERFLQRRHARLGACLDAVIRRRYATELQPTDAVCDCGRRLVRRRFDAKQVSTLQGTITLHRPCFYCDVCERGCHPLDATLELSERHQQFDVQERTTRLGADLPFGLSAEQFAHLTGIAASPHFSHDTLNAVGEAATMERVIPDGAEIGRRIDEARGDSPRRPVLVVASDGAMAPTRPPGGRRKKRGPGGWREAKGVRIYLLGKDQRAVGDEGDADALARKCRHRGSMILRSGSRSTTSRLSGIGLPQRMIAFRSPTGTVKSSTNGLLISKQTRKRADPGRTSRRIY